MTDLEKMKGKHINLVATKSKMRLTPIETVFFIVLFILIGAFAKFAVFDPLASTAVTSQEVRDAQREYDMLLAANAEMSGLKDEYERYVVENMTDEELNLVDRGEIIDILQTNVREIGALSSVGISGNVVTIAFYGADLQVASTLVERLEADHRVSHVSISSAQSRASASTTVTIIITMKTPTEAKESSAESSTAAPGDADSGDADSGSAASGNATSGNTGSEGSSSQGSGTAAATEGASNG